MGMKRKRTKQNRSISCWAFLLIFSQIPGFLSPSSSWSRELLLLSREQKSLFSSLCSFSWSWVDEIWSHLFSPKSLTHEMTRTSEMKLRLELLGFVWESSFSSYSSSLYNSLLTSDRTRKTHSEEEETLLLIPFRSQSIPLFMSVKTEED